MAVPDIWQWSEFSGRNLQDVGHTIFLDIKAFLVVALRPVNRIVRKILQEVRPGFRLREEAVDELHHDVEDYTIKPLMKCNALWYNGKSITIMPNDLRLALRLHGARN